MTMGFLLRLLGLQQGVALGRHALGLALAGSSGLGALGVHLLLKSPLAGLLSLGAVDLCRVSVLRSRGIKGGWQRANVRAQPGLSCA